MTILITGANRGIGKYLYDYFKSQEFYVYGTYHTTKPEIEDSNLLKVDVSSKEQVDKWIQNLDLPDKKLILINAAGILKQGFAHKINLVDWDDVINVNLRGTMNVIRSVLPIMRSENYGRIINFSSVVATKGIAGTSAYAASKSGLLGLTKAIAVENAIKGITINSISLGYFDIGMVNVLSNELLNGIIQNIPMKRLGNKKDILLAVNFLIGCEYITGSTIDINGGLY